MGSRFRLGLIATVAGVMLLSPDAMAQSSEYVTQNQLQSAQEEISSLSSNLDARVAAAQKALEDVQTMDETSEREALISQRFDAIEGEVRTVLAKVSLNSPFSDAMDDARARTLVLKRWYERQPADYPLRDQSIGRLDAAIAAYEAQANTIQQTSDDALQALTELGKARSVIIQQLKIGRIETSVKRLDELTQALSALSNKLATIAETQLPDSEPTPAIGQN